MEKLIKNIILLLLLLEICYVPAFADATEQNIGKDVTGKPIFIDSRLLILAHPLFKAFDSKSRRFKGTSSESFENDFESREAFIQEIKDTEDELLKSPELLKEKLKTVPFKDRINAEIEFMLEKKTKEAKLESMKRRVYLSRLVPTKDGLTPYMSIYPQCRDLAEAIRKIVELLKAKYKTDIVIDVANILPFKERLKIRQQELRTNLIREAYKKDSKASVEELSQWLNAANSYWAAVQGMCANIIPVGANDVRIEAIKLMEEEGKGYKLWNW